MISTFFEKANGLICYLLPKLLLILILSIPVAIYCDWDEIKTEAQDSRINQAALDQAVRLRKANPDATPEEFMVLIWEEQFERYMKVTGKTREQALEAIHK